MLSQEQKSDEIMVLEAGMMYLTDSGLPFTHISTPDYHYSPITVE